MRFGTFLTVTSLIIIFSSVSECLVCLSSFCPNGELACNDYCTKSSDVCHLISHSLYFNNFDTIEMACSHSTHNCSHDCNLAPTGIGNVHYCCCDTDYCNHVPGETNHLIPSLEIGTVQPTVSPPSDLNYTVCEEYRCKPDKSSCFHGYKICEESDNGMMPYCSSSYKINEDQQLELLIKGCEYELVMDCIGSDECHVDNPLNGQVNDFYMCCCNRTLCNQNETFTHPTEHSKYGFNECQELGCHHSCLIENNIPQCLCDDGYALLDDSTQCVDIDECALGLANCDSLNQMCINNEGGFECACILGFHYDKNLQQCLDDDGIVCQSFRCSNVTENDTCIMTVEHCAIDAHESLLDPKNHYCQSTYLFVDDYFQLRFSTCLLGPHSDCNNDQCILERGATPEPYYFCCCYGDLCNAVNNVQYPNTSTVVITTTTMAITLDSITSTDLMNISLSTSVIVDEGNTESNILIQKEFIAVTVVIVTIALLIVLIVIVICTTKYCNTKQKPYLSSAIDNVINGENCSPLEIPILDTVIGQGRFAKVYRAILNKEQVAIKIFNNTYQARDSWSKEKEIYSTPELQHSNILHFLDADRYMHEGEDAFRLIFEYQPNGSLYDYLQHCTVSLQEFSTLSQTAACGLAHLHSEVSHGSVVKKPAIAHRDLKSKNILVKSDMTSCISDFGLAIKLNQGEHPSDAQGQVGTSRYMAPEVLEGAISFYQESFLRIDVYAFGLVVWELASRCDIPGKCSLEFARVRNLQPCGFQGVYEYPVELTIISDSINEYLPPFEDIVSQNPSIEEMKTIVADQQKRPLIPQGFRINSEYQGVVDTIVESWDPEAEARPSAHLIETRLNHFCDVVNPLKKHNRKDSTYSTATHPVPSPITITSSDNPLPLTPSSSPCITLSPSDTKTMQFDCQLPDQLYYSSSCHSVVDSGNISDELRDTYNNNSRPSVLSGNVPRHMTLSSSPRYHSNIDCHATTNTMNQLETSI